MRIGQNILLGLVAGLSIACVILLILWRTSTHDFAKYKLDVEIASERTKDEIARIEKESAQVSADTATGWAAAVEYWRNQPGRVRVTNSCGGAVPTVPGLAGESADAHVEESRPGAIIDVAECEARLNEAVLDAAWIEHVKVWAKKQSGVGRE